jgi:DNA-binding response OmpR family regulator
MVMKYSILIVDDHSGITETMALALEDIYNVKTAENGKEALEKMEDFKPNLIISDIMMPVMDGLEFLKACKESSEYKDIPFILLSAKGLSSRSVEKGLELGAYDYISKPFEMEELRTRVKTITHHISQDKQVKKNIKTGISGNLEEINILEVLQMLQIGNKTGVLTLVKSERKAKVFFQRGKLVNCKYGKLDGIVALQRILSWEKGHFFFEISDEDMEVKIELNTQQVMMEGVQILDEVNKIKNKLNLDGNKFYLTYRANTAENLNEVGEFIITSVGNGVDIDVLVEKSRFDELTLYQELENLFEKGYLTLKQEEASISQKTILVIDDSISVRKLMEYMLQKAGYNVITASDGEMGLEKAKETMPNLILLDMQILKGIGGMETCKKFREDPDFIFMPIVFLTGGTEKYTQEEIDEVGANGVFLKTSGYKKTVEMVRSFLGDD